MWVSENLRWTHTHILDNQVSGLLIYFSPLSFCSLLPRSVTVSGKCTDESRISIYARPQKIQFHIETGKQKKNEQSHIIEVYSSLGSARLAMPIYQKIFIFFPIRFVFGMTFMCQRTRNYNVSIKIIEKRQKNAATELCAKVSACVNTKYSLFFFFSHKEKSPRK